MAVSFFFYDLETSGFNPREARIMQFAGQRTDLNLKPVEEPHNYLIRLSDDVVPDPDAVLITGITPQQTISEGLGEAEFLRLFYDQIATPDTIFVGFNSIWFDDEFMRYMHYRNFYDAYEWQWRENRSRWDLLDLVRMTRALRPEGIQWPFDASGNPANRLELLTSVNKLEHTTAHDALSDVRAAIALARLIYTKQPKLFEFLLGMRDKKRATALVTSGQPFIYTSGKYSSEFEKTTVVGMLAEHPKRAGALVFDLRYDPRPFAKLSPGELAQAMHRRKDDPGPRVPLKTLQYNRCPAIAPLIVLDGDSQKRLNLKPKTYETNFKWLQKIKPELSQAVFEALELLDEKQQARLLEDETEVDSRLYDGFFENADKSSMSVVRAASPDELSSLAITFKDKRLEALLPLYKARNFRKTLSSEERQVWERFRERKLLGGGDQSRLSRYFGRLGELQNRKDLTDQQRYLLEELQLYGQSILPVEG